MLSQLYTFLSAHPRETVIFCIQQEAPSSTLFSSLVRSNMEDGISRGLWYLEDRIPLLGQVRGKAILMSRFGGGRDGGLDPWMVDIEGQMELRIGWHPGSWPDSKLEGFEWDCGGMTVRTQDW
jgi:1-phosphatidylinositol phosphodiesterase